MPILEFKDDKMLELWVAKYVTPQRYMIVTTLDNEFIVQPTKTSRPSVYGYLRTKTLEKLMEISAKFVDAGFFVLEVKSYSWDTERQSGVKE